MDYKKIGAYLKKEREQKGLSYQQVFEITRIQPSIIRSIEEGEPQISEVFFKNFIKTYMNFLGLDLSLALKEDDTKKTSQKEELESFEKKKSSKIRVKLFVFIGLGFFVFLILFRFLFDKPQLDLIVNSSPKMEDEKQLKDEEADSKLKSGSKEGEEPSEEGYRKNQDKTELTDGDVLEAGEISSNSSGEILAKDEDLKAQGIPSLFQQTRAGDFQQELMIKSLEPLKIYFKIDQQSTLTKDLSPSVWFVIKARESLYIRFDEKVDQVEMFYNGVRWNFTSSRFFEKTFKTQPVKP